MDKELISMGKELSLRNSFINNAKRIYRNKSMDFISDNFNPLTDSQMRTLKDTWVSETMGLYEPDGIYHTHYTNIYGSFSPEFIDDAFLHSMLLRTLNPKDFRSFKDKNYMSLLLKDTNQPKVLARRISGMLLDENFNSFSTWEFLNLLKNAGPFVIKPSLKSEGGSNIKFFQKYDEAVILDIANSSNTDFVIQEKISQHENMSKYNKSSINTLRFYTMMLKGEIHLLSSFLRIGNCGSSVDNYSAGGVACSINEDGTCNKTALGKKTIYKNEFNGFKFAGTKIPSFKEACEMVETLHKKLSVFFLIAWDIAIDKKNEPMLIEFNVNYPYTEFAQALSGPLFGKYFGDVMKLFRESCKIPCDDNLFSYNVIGTKAIITGFKNKTDKNCKDISLPEIFYGRTVSEISAFAFDGSPFLEKITLPKSIEKIDKNAFRDCQSLKKVLLKNKHIEIDETAFSYSPKVEKIFD